MKLTTLASAILVSWIVASPAGAELQGGVTGIVPTGVVCRNLTTGQTVVSASAATHWDCADLGLDLAPGDRVETRVRGAVPHAETTAPGAPLVPEDFVSHIQEDVDMNGGRALLGDLDADGDLDLVASNRFVWFENLGGSPPAFQKHFLGGPEPTAAEHLLIDINGDERLDIVAGFGLDTNQDELLWYKNIGGSPPDFVELPVVATPGSRVGKLAGGDIDGDGDTDLYATFFTNACPPCDEDFVWLENQGDGFEQHLLKTQNGGGSELLAHDVDLDGDLDLVVSNFLADSVGWIENQGDGVFGVERFIDIAEVRFLVAGDVDGDGDGDIVTYHGDTDELLWYEMVGSGDVAVHAIGIFPGQQSDGLALADFSADGRLDIAIGDNVESLTWLENQGGSPPAFEVHTVVVEEPTPIPVAGDMDGDGRPDLVATNVLCWTWQENLIGLRLSVTGPDVRGFECRNRTSGKSVRVESSEKEIDCEYQGLTVQPGDEVEAMVRGRLPLDR